MKLNYPTLGVGLLASLAMATAEPVFVNFNYDIARSYAGDGVSFLPLDPNPLPTQHLLGMGDTNQNPIAIENANNNGISNSNENSALHGDGDGAGDYTTCSVSNTNGTASQVAVLIAISKCLSDAALNVIKSWADSLKTSESTFFQHGQTSTITFATVSVPGTCQSTNMLMSSDEVLPQDVERLAAFNEVGRVLEEFPTSTTGYSKTPNTVVESTIPIAMISFVDNYKSYDAVQQYELMAKISTTFNFKICGTGLCTSTNAPNAIALQEPVDVFMYSPFKVTSNFHCSKLTDGIPVTYVDVTTKGSNCICMCPAGTTLKSLPATANAAAATYSCETVTETKGSCAWANAPGGFVKPLTSLDMTLPIKGMTTWGFPAPIPIDNYVAKGRDNKYDFAPLTLTDGPHVELKTTRINNATYNADAVAGDGGFGSMYSALPSDITTKLIVATPAAGASPPSTANYPWKAYQQDRAGAVNKLEFAAFGKYQLDLVANDYNASATCSGWLAVVDKYRPQHTTVCPTKKCDTATCNGDEGVVELTEANRATIDALVDKYFEYQEKASNNGGSSGRCDDDKITVKRFLDNDYTPGTGYTATGKAFFDAATIRGDIIASNANPLVRSSNTVSQDETPVTNGQCKRCVNLSTKLREFWTDYKCSRDYDIQRCDGDDCESCGLKQCAVAYGTTIAVASAGINGNVKTESKKVIAEMPPLGYNPDTQIHVALQCTGFVDNVDRDVAPDAKCVYSNTVANLVDISAIANANSIFTQADVDALVYWRYRVDTGAWKLWSDQTSFDFKKAETKVTIEAWTQCGLVRKFYFYVDLHLNNDIKVCDNFRSMWYQTTNPKLTAPDNFCTYPKSDFAEVTFDYHANIGLQYSPDKLLMNISSVVCRLNYDGLSAVEIVSGGDFNTPEIVKRFAVEAARKPTSALTKFHVTCDFMYKRYAPQAPLTQTCNQDFYITDCTGPEMVNQPFPSYDPTCPADKCVGDPKPAPFEACGGNIVSLGAAGTLLSPASATDKECCAFCAGKYTSTCTTLSTLPVGQNSIKRCELTTKTTGGNLLAASTFMATSADVVQSASQGSAGSVSTMLLSASALVALVALVVVKRRRTPAGRGTAKTDIEMMEDAYFPLLN